MISYEEFQEKYPPGAMVKIISKTAGDLRVTYDIGIIAAIDRYDKTFDDDNNIVVVAGNFYSHTDLEPITEPITEPIKQESKMDINAIIAQHIEAEVQKRISELEKESTSETVARLQKQDPDGFHDACARLDVFPTTEELMKIFYHADKEDFIDKVSATVDSNSELIPRISNQEIVEYINRVREPSEFLSEFTSGQLLDALKEKEVNLTHVVLNMIEHMNMEECESVFKVLWKDFKNKLVVEL